MGCDSAAQRSSKNHDLVRGVSQIESFLVGRLGIEVEARFRRLSLAVTEPAIVHCQVSDLNFLEDLQLLT